MKNYTTHLLTLIVLCLVVTGAVNAAFDENADRSATEQGREAQLAVKQEVLKKYEQALRQDIESDKPEITLKQKQLAAQRLMALKLADSFAANCVDKKIGSDGNMNCYVIDGEMLALTAASTVACSTQDMVWCKEQFDQITIQTLGEPPICKTEQVGEVFVEQSKIEAECLGKVDPSVLNSWLCELQRRYFAPSFSDNRLKESQQSLEVDIRLCKEIKAATLNDPVLHEFVWSGVDPELFVPTKLVMALKAMEYKNKLAQPVKQVGLKQEVKLKLNKLDLLLAEVTAHVPVNETIDAVGVRDAFVFPWLDLTQEQCDKMTNLRQTAELINDDNKEEVFKLYADLQNDLNHVLQQKRQKIAESGNAAEQQKFNSLLEHLHEDWPYFGVEDLSTLLHGVEKIENAAPIAAPINAVIPGETAIETPASVAEKSGFEKFVNDYKWPLGIGVAIACVAAPAGLIFVWKKLRAKRPMSKKTVHALVVSKRHGRH